MGQQPAYRPLEPSAFFPDGQSARPLVAGTVARGQLRDELTTFAHGDRTEARPVAVAVGLGAVGPLAAAVSMQAAAPGRALADYVREFPFPVTRAVLERGRERYNIYCAVCHGPTGRGDGKIVERGYTRPPSFVDGESRGFKYRGVRVLLRDAPAGYYYEVISKGFGAMPDYAAQVPPRDRWAGQSSPTSVPCSSASTRS
jgi:mono/diheme cytochrome c family protein